MAEEEVQPAAKKGGSKLMIIIICAVMLVTGGFFGLKMKASGNKEKEPAIKPGEIAPIKEFLVNLQEPGTQVYLRTELALQMVEGYKKEQLDAVMPAIQDAINRVLSSHRVSEIRSTKGKDALKREIATAVNEALIRASDKPIPKPKTIIHHDDWDSDTGPVLKVYFTSFAFQ